MIAKLRFLFTVLCLVIMTLVVLPFQFLAVLFKLKLSKKIPLIWHKIALKLIGFDVIVKGQIHDRGPRMIIANHTSWTDIPVLGSISEVCFIAKQEVGEMPGAGLLARMQRTVFVKREAKRAVGAQVNEIQERLLDGDVMVLFGEGSTGNGSNVGPFKSSLLGAAQYAIADGHIDHVYIQPVSIAYTRLQGMPLGRFKRTKSAWYGDMSLGPHALFIMLSSAWTVEVTFGDVIKFDKDSNRREVSKLAQSRVRNMFVKSVHHRGDEVLALEHDAAN